MNKTGFFILSGVTVALIVGTIAIQPASTSSNPEPGKRFFPSLSAKELSGVDSLKITAKGKSFTVMRKDKSWVVKEKDGFPANLDQVKQALVSLSELREFERKTADPKLHKKLDLDDPSRKESDAKRLTVSKGGKVVADVIIGKSNQKEILAGRSLVYVRRPKNNQAWLAVGDPKLAGEALKWVPKKVIDVSTARMKEIVQTDKKGDVVKVVKSKPDAKEFKLDNKPADRALKGPRYLGYIAEGLANVNLENVRAAKGIDFKKDGIGSAIFRTFDGLVVTATLAEVGPKKDATVWVTLKASFDEKAALKGKPKKGSKLKAAADVKKEVAEINKKTQGWAYELSSTITRFMRYKMDDLLKKAPKKKVEKKPAGKDGAIDLKTLKPKDGSSGDK